MKKIPKSKDLVVVRTDFSDGAAWKAIQSAFRQPRSDRQTAFAKWAALMAAIGEPIGKPQVKVVDDPDYRDITKDHLLELVPKTFNHAVLFVVDRIAVSHPDHPILVIDLETERGREFRTIPSQIQGIESNLSIANLDWEDFADNLDEAGIFRGFGE